MELERTVTVRSTPSRHEKSLGLLTMKFVSLLQEAEDGVLDLKVVSDTKKETLSRYLCVRRWGNVVQRCAIPAISTASFNKGLFVTSQVYRCMEQVH